MKSLKVKLRSEKRIDSGWILKERTFLKNLRRARSNRSSADVCMGIGDDTAVLQGDSSHRYLITSDLLVESIHFDFSYITPWELGFKTVAVSFSDIAAMGGVPAGIFLSLAVPKHLFHTGFMDPFYEGVQSVCDVFQCTVLGGDTTRSPGPLVIDGTALGKIRAGKELYRQDALPGDDIYISGPLGLSAAGLDLLQTKKNVDLKNLYRRHKTPFPCCRLGSFLAESGLVNSCIDISDSLISELEHLCEESSCGARIMQQSLPVHPDLEIAAGYFKKNLMNWIFNGGEDYQLLFTAGKKNRNLLSAELQKNDFQVFRIGKMTKDRRLELQNEKKRIVLHRQGFEHF